MSEVVMGTLYDLNKNILLKETPIDINKAFTDIKIDFVNFLAKHCNTFYMLLCNERKDYTIFQCKSFKSSTVMLDELKECIKNRGELLSIEPTEDGFAYEIWTKIDENVFVYYLFPYDNAVIEC